MLFDGPDKPQNCLFLGWRFQPYLIHGFLGPRESATQPTNSISIGSVLFAGLTRVPNEQTLTIRPTDHALRAISVEIHVGRINAMRLKIM